MAKILFSDYFSWKIAIEYQILVLQVAEKVSMCPDWVPPTVSICPDWGPLNVSMCPDRGPSNASTDPKYMELESLTHLTGHNLDTLTHLAVHNLDILTQLVGHNLDTLTLSQRPVARGFQLKKHFGCRNNLKTHFSPCFQCSGGPNT